jgi:ribosomal protein S27E
LFEDIPNSRKNKVRCTVCGKTGYPGGRWQDAHRRGHRPCPRCGGVLAVLANGNARTHPRCPEER